MATYISALSVDNATPTPIGSSLFGICNTRINAAAKIVTLSNFDELREGVTIHVKFTYGNRVALNDSLTLAVGNTSPCVIKNPGGTANWPEGAIISFTYNNSQWCVNDGLISSFNILNTYDPASQDSISGMGVADALSTLGAAAEYDVVTTIVESGINSNKNSTDLPTTAAITAYVDSKVGGTESSVHFVGVTTTALTNGAQTTPIYINGQPYTPENGDMVIAPSGQQFIWYNGSWSSSSAETSMNYGVCTTQATVADKTVTIPSFVLEVGVNIHVKFQYKNTSINPTLNVNNTGALPMVLFNAQAFGTEDETSGWYAGALISLVYDGTCWQRDQGYNTNDSVVQLSSNDSHAYSILLKNSATAVDETGGTKYSGLVSVNPNTGFLFAERFVGSGAGLTDIDATSLTGGPIPLSIFDNESIPNNKLQYSYVTVAGRQWNLGDTISAATLRQDLHIESSLHFAGFATVPILDESNTDPMISGYNFGENGRDAAVGDVIIDRDSSREFIWTGSQWEMLGQDALSQIYEVTTSGNQWIASITQNTDRSISVTTRTLDTTGLWSGNAATATEWLHSTKVYVNLGLTSLTETINGSSSANAPAQEIGIDGILSVSNGGTGVSNFPVDQVILSNNTAGNGVFSSLGYKDNSSATAITNAHLFVTERSVYYGLPQINHSHAYTSDTEIYAPTESGSQNHILIATGTNTTPVWSLVTQLDSNLSIEANVAAYDTLILGNSGKIDTTTGHSEGRLLLFSSMSHSHMITGQATDSTNYTHILPNTDGWIVIGDALGVGASANQLMYLTSSGTLAISNLTIGGVAQPIYLNQGTFTAITSTIGSEKNLIYMDDGVLTASSTSEGGTSQPVWLDNGVLTALTFEPNRLYFSSSVSSFTYTGHYASLDKVAINSASAPNTNFFVSGTSQFDGRVGIGVAPDAATQGDIHILSIEGSTLISVNENSVSYDVAHLDVATEGEQTTVGTLFFYPEFDEHGTIGTTNNKWNAGYFSDSINLIDDSGNSAVLASDGTLTLTSDSTAIILENTDLSGDNWEILNTVENSVSIFKIHDVNDSSYIYGQTGDGFEISPAIYINDILPQNPTYTLLVNGKGKLVNQVGIGVDADSSMNNYAYLTVQDYIKLVHNNTAIAHLYYREVNNITSTLFFYPDSSENGYLGQVSNRWQYGYFSDAINLSHNTNSIDINNILGTFTITASAPTIILNTTASGQSDWQIYNTSNGIFTITDNGTENIYGTSGHGFELQQRLYINSSPQQNTYNLFVGGVNGISSSSKFDGYVGINADSDDVRTRQNPAALVVQDYFKLVSDSSNTNNDIVHLLYDPLSAVGLRFYPETDTTGFIGLEGSNRWNSLYLFSGLHITDKYNNAASDEVHITTEYSSNGSSSLSQIAMYSEIVSNQPKLSIELNTGKGTNTEINMLATENSGQNALISMNSLNPTIELNTVKSGRAQWTIHNDQGAFWLEDDSVTDLTFIKGSTGLGFKIEPRLYLNADPSASDYSLYVNGETYFNDLVTSNANIVPATTNTYSLGTTDLRWATLYIGTADTYGDPYTPIYWNDGKPSTVSPIQYANWTIPTNSDSVTIVNDAYDTNSFVITLVVTSGQSHLNGVLSWDTDTQGELTIYSSEYTSGAVSGYVITARGVNLTPSSGGSGSG